jgi:molybdenum cofactor cytidylyltransferase
VNQESSIPGVCAILLAAGESRRMGELKALLPWRGSPLVSYQVDSLIAAGVDQVVVVLGHRAEELRPLLVDRDNVSRVINPLYLQGKTTSIRAGIAVLDRSPVSDVLLLNVDQPRTPETVRRVLETHRSRDFAITVPEYQGKGGHPIVLSASLIPELRAIDEESQGIKAVVRRHADTVNRVPLAEPEILLDLNTPEQYRAAVEANDI